MNNKKRCSTRIARQPGKQGARSSVGDQTMNEKSSTSGRRPHSDDEEDSLTEETQRGSLTKETSKNNIAKRQRWTRGEYKTVMKAYYKAIEYRNETSNTKETYRLWRAENQEERPYMDENKLANVRRDIVNMKRLSDAELEEIRKGVKGTDTEVANGTHVDNNNEVSEVQDDGNEHALPPTPHRNEHTEQISQEDQERIGEMKTKILQKWLEVKEESMMERSRLPKIKTNRKTKKVIDLANKCIEEIKKDHKPKDITDINSLMYSAAHVVTTETSYRPIKKNIKKKNRRSEPMWKEKLKKEIERLRKDVSIITEMQNPNSNISESKKRKMRIKYKIRSMDNVPEVRESLLQQISAKAQRLRRMDKRQKQFHQNRLFKENPRQLYRELGKKEFKIEKTPKKEEMENFWKKIWEDTKQHDVEASWIREEEELHQDLQEQEWKEITVEEYQCTIMKGNNWKSPGVDKLPNFWLKYITSLHSEVVSEYNLIMKEPEKTPEWLTRGTTHLLPKNETTENPKNYRPITCLSTTYKALTSILSNRTYQYLEENNLLPVEQKGCRRGSYGCKDQLLINKMILENVKARSRNISTAWIDYKKAFDSVPHSWIAECLRIYKISPVTRNFLQFSMSQWKTNLILSHDNGKIRSDEIHINNGIFQGDSYSPLLFCIALMPLSNQLNKTTCGYDIYNEKISHLFFMDDLKLYARNNNQLETLLHTVKQYSQDIRMDFGLDKCAKATFIKGKLISSNNIKLNEDITIKDLNQEGFYKYLGVKEKNGIQHAQMKEDVRKEYYRRIRMILKSELNSINRITAINSLAVPVVSYSFNIINWTLSDLRRMDRKTRKMLTIYNMHHPRADVERLYIPRKEGGRGLLQLEMTYKLSTVGLDKYLSEKDDSYIKIVYQHENAKKTSSIVKEAKKYSKGITVTEGRCNDCTVTENVRKFKNQVKKRYHEEMQQKWRDKPMHGQYIQRLEKADTDIESTNNWLRSSQLKGETEGFIIAAQDQSLTTRLYQSQIIKDGTDPKCRLCNQHNESIDHIVSSCPALAKQEYLERHNKLASYIHWTICKKNNFEVATNWYDHTPQRVMDSSSTTILWDMSIHTDREIAANRPDIIIKDKVEKTCYLIDIAIPNDNNVGVKELEKRSKYKDLEIELARMWDMQVINIPIVIGALGLIRKGMIKNMSKISETLRIELCQKVALLGTARILRKTLSL